VLDCPPHPNRRFFVLTRRALLASAAVSPLLAAGYAATRAQVDTPGEDAMATPVATPQDHVVADLTGVTPLPLTGERLATFEAYVAAKLADAGVPGAAVAVVQNGEVVFQQGFGVREIGQPAPVTPDTLLRIGSVTKSFSSLLTATLVDAGRLSWDTPLVDLLPAFAVADPALTPRLTARDAFCACTGLPRRDFEFIFNAHELTPELLIEGMAELPLTAPYGEKYQYSNQMVAAGGFAAAAAAGGSPHDLGHAYAIALRERVLNPIGMPQTTLALTDVLADDDYAIPHAADVTGALHPLELLDDDPWLVPVAPSGALWSSASEMARYVQTELRKGVNPDGRRVVSAENLERTWQPSVALQAGPGTPPDMAAFAGHYALGWVLGSYGGQRLVWHSGGTLGFTALVSFLPDADLGVVTLTNGSGTAGPFTYAVQFRLFELLFDQPAAFSALLETSLSGAAEARADLLAHLGEIDPAAVRPYLGRYANSDLGEVVLVLQGDSLILIAGAVRSQLLPRMDDDGAVTGYLTVTPPWASNPPEAMLTLEDDGDRPKLVMSVRGDPGDEDVVYTFEPVELVATPTP
jgi:CubicO group peptidase (beta-lactamase class C family)